MPEGFEWSTIISWGDPILADAPDFDFDHQSAAAQEGQFGYNNDYTTLIRTKDQNAAVLVCNNEYTNDELMFRGYTGSASLTPEQVRITMAAHGMSVVELRRASASRPWEYVKGAPLNRRITATTPFRVDGPAAGHPLLRTSTDPSGRRVLGTFGNCSGGTTPWGTVLSGEENFQGYFNATAIPADQDAAYRRYGITGKGRGWEKVDTRFDTGAEPNEVNRFGYVIEVDPSDPSSTPVKHTALGRLKHEGANVTIAPDGRVVAYTGDDERFDYLYKFVSHGSSARVESAEARANNLTLLSSGDLYVAQFTGDGFEDGVADGTGDVAAARRRTTRAACPACPSPRCSSTPASPPTRSVPRRWTAPRTSSPTRSTAAPTSPAPTTPSARPRRSTRPTRAPTTSTGTSSRSPPTAATTPRPASRGRSCSSPATRADPSTYFNGYDRSEVSPISCPDNVAFDREGNLWIATDGNALGHCDGMYLMPLSGPHKGHLQQFLSVPAYAECCGPLVTWDQKTVLAAVQHPGEVDGASPEKPASQFPYQGDGQPRPSVIQVRPA